LVEKSAEGSQKGANVLLGDFCQFTASKSEEKKLRQKGAKLFILL
jgi:hypothetical protein